MEKEMNIYLSDLIVEYHKLQNFHWYVKGKDFFATHVKLEELYNAMLVKIDSVAEAMLMNKMQPVASLKEFSALTKIEEASAEYRTTKDVYNAVLADFEYIQASNVEIKKMAESLDLFHISSVMDEFIALYAKDIWMLRQELMD